MGQHSTDNYNEFFLLGICSFPNARRENGGDNWWKKGVVLVFFNVMNLTLECLRISVFMYSKRPRDQEWRGKHGSILISRLFFETFFYLFKVSNQRNLFVISQFLIFQSPISLQPKIFIIFSYEIFQIKY